MLTQVTAEELGLALHGPQPPRIIDVREPDEFSRGHLKGAQSIPLGILGAEFEKRFPNRSEPVVLYCDMGIRSHHGAQLLRSKGYKNVQEIMGGMLSLTSHPKNSKGLIANS